MFEERKKESDPNNVFLRRVALLVFLWLCVVGLLTARIFYLTVVRGQDLFYLSEQNFLRQVKIPSPRGPIVDRYGRLLATSEPRFDLSISPFKKIPPTQLKKTVLDIHALCPDLKMPSVESVAKLKPGMHRALAGNLALHTAIPLLERQANLPGLQIEQSFVRVYPLGRATAHLTGFARKINPKAMDSYLEEGYDRDDIVGATGLEKTQEAFLRGVNGIEVEHRDAMGRLMSSPRVQRDAISGSRVVLTIDADLQNTASLLLQGLAGAIVAVDPRNGDILTLAANPCYDANHPVPSPGSGDSHFNRAIQEHYAPGSTFKLVTSLAWLMTGHSPNRTVFCGGKLTVAPGLTLKCNVDWGHGTVDMRQALMVSCNCYFYQLSKELRQENLYDAAKLLGYGEPSGIPILKSGESKGILVNPSARAAKYLGNRVMMGIGQGELISVTPLQQAMAYCAVANGGILYAPRIVERVELADGRQIVNPPVQRRVMPWTEAERQVLLDGFRMVVEETRGTAHKAMLPKEWRVAGKTGTAQRHKPPDAWFVCFAPWDNPEICVVVMLERSGHGGEMAAPVARQYLDAYFRLKQQRAGAPPALSPDPQQMKQVAFETKK